MPVLKLNPDGEARGTIGSSLRTIAADPRCREKYIHAVSLTADLAGPPCLSRSDFSDFDGRVLLLLPRQDIFSTEDQEKLIALMPNPDVHFIPGGHLACVMRAEKYIEEIKAFLPSCDAATK